MRLCLLATGLLLLNSGATWAHALGAECSLKNGKVSIEAYFDDDTPAVNALVEIHDGADKIVSTGKTDVKGFCSLPAPVPGQYRVVVEAGMGHRKTIAITVPGTLAPPSVPPETISVGPTREEFTRFPYVNVGVGLAAILLISLLFLFARKKW